MTRPATVLTLLATLSLHAGEPGAVHYQLRGGGEIKGIPLKEAPEQVIVDIGPVLVAIPRASIVEEKKAEEKTAAQAGPIATDIYFLSKGRPERAVEKLVEEVGEAVVEIRTRTGLGSGFIIHPDGFVMTNNHVVNGETRLTVTLFRKEAGTQTKVLFRNVRIVAMDPVRDLALLKIDDEVPRPFLTVPFGDSETLKPGQPVFAVGSPLGLDRTVSQGIVSLPNRLMGEGHLAIQTTTQINPGNSGGPLFNLSGEVVGVNSRKAAEVGVEGLGFSIPANVVLYFLQKRDAFAFDPRNPNTGVNYLDPPRKSAAAATPSESTPKTKE